MINKMHKTPEKIAFELDMSFELANAIRRSVAEIPILAVDEVDIYKNDSALYDEYVSHRIGLMPLKNQKLGKDKTISLKLKSKGEGNKTEVLSGEFGKDVVYEDMPLVLLGKDQEIEVVARAKQGKGVEHAKYIPGLAYYRNACKIKIDKEGEKHSELAEIYPNIFEFDGKLKVKNSWACDLDQDDVKSFKGISIDETGNLVFIIESWGQIKPEEIFLESIKALKDNLDELSKALK